MVFCPAFSKVNGTAKPNHADVLLTICSLTRTSALILALPQI